MGYTIIPICNNCGYKTKAIAIGGGRLNHNSQCGAPALNTESNEIEGINLYDYKKTIVIKKRFLYFFYRNIMVEKTNQKYIPYYDSKMFVDDIDVEEHQWSNTKYKKSKNFCPKCKTFNLDFVDTGIYFD
jgi:hypothetical protein